MHCIVGFLTQSSVHVAETVLFLAPLLEFLNALFKCGTV